MSLLKNLKTDESIANERDSVGGGGPVDSGLYLATIKLAYITKAASEALGLTVVATLANGSTLRETQWMTSGKAKGGNNFFIDKSGAKQYLPGFNMANSLALLATGKEINELDTETKVVNIYSFDAKAEIPTKVDMVVDLLGKELMLGVIKQVVDKNVKDAAGAYVPSGETRAENTIDKAFRARDRMTTAEIRAQATEATFATTWETKWAGKTRDKSVGSKGGNGAAGAPKTAAVGTKKPATSLFV